MLRNKNIISVKEVKAWNYSVKNNLGIIKPAEEMNTELKYNFSQPSLVHVSLLLKKSFVPNHSMALKQAITRLLRVSSAIQSTSKMAYASWLQRA